MNRKNDIPLQGHGAAELEATLRHRLARSSVRLQVPLPTTRDLAGRFAIANTTAYRVLLKLRGEGLIWRQENGRFFPAGSRELLEKPKPFACLLRRLETWSTVYEGVMAGFSQVCGRHRRGMLLVHNESLVQHPDLSHPPQFASTRLQESAFREFVRCHAATTGGILLDNAWNDTVLAHFENELRNAVVVCRPTPLAFLSSVTVDFHQVALMAIGRLFARGFREIWIAVPFENDATVDLMIENAVAVSRELGTPIADRNIARVATPAEQNRFVERLKPATERVGVFCPEDNVACLLYDQIRAAGLACPGKVGFLSGFGTSPVQKRGITSIQCNFEEIGRKAAEVLNAGERRQVVLPPQMLAGRTT